MIENRKLGLMNRPIKSIAILNRIVYYYIMGKSEYYLHSVQIYSGTVFSLITDS